MLTLLADRFMQLLAAMPDGVLPQGRLGMHRPASLGDLPALTLALEGESPRTLGLGAPVRAGHVRVLHTATVSVDETSGFLPGLRTLRIAPLPLRKNPSATEPAFGADDITIRRLAPAPVVDYRIVPQPTAINEFAVDTTAAAVQFGAPQLAGAALEVSHWTMEWRSDIPLYRWSGCATVELWATTAAQVEDLARRAERRLHTDHAVARTLGFLRLTAAAIGASELVEQQPPTGPFGVWRQVLAFRYDAEIEESIAVSSGSPITRIDVATPHEGYAVPLLAVGIP